MELRQELAQKQALSQRMIQSAQILQMGTQELERYLRELATENPLAELEEPSPDSREGLPGAGHSDRLQEPGRPEAGGGSWPESLAEHVGFQLLTECKEERQRKIFEHLAQSLDSRGYLDAELGGIRERFALAPNECMWYLERLWRCDPPGVGARSLPECLLLQLARKKEDTALAKRIVEGCLELLGKNRLPQIARKLDCPLEEVKRAAGQIRELNPKPGNGFSDHTSIKNIRPDVLILRSGDTCEIRLHEAAQPRLRVSEGYLALAEDPGLDPETEAYIRSRLAQVQWAIRCVKQREETLKRVTEALVKRQAPFFGRNRGDLLPVSMGELAKELDLHVSTVSRAVREKYLQCERGVFAMSALFSKALAEGGKETATPETAKQRLGELLEAEDKRKPLSDQKLAEQMAALGIPLSRRTVAKYRSEMGVPGAGSRKEY